MENQPEISADRLQHIERLINNLELCHHKAERHVELIIQAIGGKMAPKGYQAQEPERKHPATHKWKAVIDILSSWLADDMIKVNDLRIGDYSGKQLKEFIGEPTALKKWQVQQIINKLKTSSRMYLGFEYHEMVEYPDKYKENQEFRDKTVDTQVKDTVNGEESYISLGTAIDHLQPCNWNFEQNLIIVLQAINGNLSPKQAFAAHGRNAKLNPIAEKMKAIAQSLQPYCDSRESADADQSIFRILGEKTPEKATLAKMLQKKINDVFK